MSDGKCYEALEAGPWALPRRGGLHHALHCAATSSHGRQHLGSAARPHLAASRHEERGARGARRGARGEGRTTVYHRIGRATCQ